MKGILKKSKIIFTKIRKICKDFSKTISIKSFKSKYLKSDAALEGLFFTNKRVKAIAIFTLSR